MAAHVTAVIVFLSHADEEN